jgi:hypothetical protein
MKSWSRECWHTVREPEQRKEVFWDRRELYINVYLCQLSIDDQKNVKCFKSGNRETLEFKVEGALSPL